MQYKSDLHFRWDDDGVTVKKTGGKRLSFPNARDAYHSKDGVIIVTSLGKEIKVDKFMNRHYL